MHGKLPKLIYMGFTHDLKGCMLRKLVKEKWLLLLDGKRTNNNTNKMGIQRKYDYEGQACKKSHASRNRK